MIDYCCQGYKAMAELEAAARESEDARNLTAAMTQLFVRTEPLGTDRFGRYFWNFDGDHRLWVETREQVGSTGETPRYDADDVVNTLVVTRPSRWTSSWKIYGSSRELSELYEALDDRGERERALRAALQQRFDIQEPKEKDKDKDADNAVFQVEGSEYLNRMVLRRFAKVTADCGLQ